MADGGGRGNAARDQRPGGTPLRRRRRATSVERDVDAFITRLADEAILRRLQDGVAAGSFDALDNWPAVAYPGFGFERYDDMQALLVIDPVHEVGDFGWPSRSADDSENA